MPNCGGGRGEGAVEKIKMPARKLLAGIGILWGFLLYFGITFFFKLWVHQVSTPGLSFGRHCKAILLEFPVFNQRTVISGVVFILIAVLFLLIRFGLIDFKSPAQVQLILIFVFYAGVARFWGRLRKVGNQKNQAHN
jgi:hypothetical protein